ncbi:MAG TPA: hypothetical protein VJK29_20540 [Terriglobales bacterium]|nr:hypothetical protein [Terriglobales bacterium]
MLDDGLPSGRLARCPAWPAHVVSSAGPGTAGADSGHGAGDRAGGDKGYDTADFVAERRNSRVNAALLTVAL